MKTPETTAANPVTTASRVQANGFQPTCSVRLRPTHRRVAGSFHVMEITLYRASFSLAGSSDPLTTVNLPSWWSIPLKLFWLWQDRVALELSVFNILYSATTAPVSGCTS